MISLDELNPKKYSLSEEQAKNLEKLHSAINKIRTAYGKPMLVTSGVRSEEDQKRINPKAPKSNHLLGLACDIADKDGKLWNWLMVNLNLLEEAGLYLEHKSATPTWVHFQACPPKSGKRVFFP